MTSIGITGSRRGITEEQKSWLKRQFAPGDQVHHGCCVGADAEAHRVAREAGARIVSHPPSNQSLMDSSCVGDSDEVREPKPYLRRNDDIVSESDILLVLPDGPPRDGSGTWYTAKKGCDAKIAVFVCFPDGQVHLGSKSVFEG